MEQPVTFYFVVNQFQYSSSLSSLILGSLEKYPIFGKNVQLHNLSTCAAEFLLLTPPDSIIYIVVENHNQNFTEHKKFEKIRMQSRTDFKFECKFKRDFTL